MGDAFICRREVLSIKPKLWLYNLGEEFEHITGGWDKKFNRFNASQGTLIKNSNHMIIESSPYYGENNCTGAGTNFLINTIGYSKLCFERNIYIYIEMDPSNVGASATIGIVSNYAPSNTGANSPFSYPLEISRTSMFGPGLMNQEHIITKIDISSVTSGYVTFDGWDLQASSIKGIVKQTIHKIWLE